MGEVMTIREAFEAEYPWMNFTRNKDDSYWNLEVRRTWETWQTAWGRSRKMLNLELAA